MMDTIVTTLGVIAAPVLGGVKAFFSIRERLALLEKGETDKKELQSVKNEAIIDKLDNISDKIDLRCDALEGRVQRIERSMNGYLKHDHDSY